MTEQQQRQATSPLRLRASLRAIRLESGPSYQEVVSRSETVETPVISTGPLPVVRPSGEHIIQAATINPAIVALTPEQQELLLAGLRTSLIGRLVRLPGGIGEMYDLFYHAQNMTRIMARVRPVGEMRS